MIRTFRYPLHPTKAQAEVLETWRIACQQLYNAALQERRDAWKKCGVTVTRYDQQKELTELRRTEPEWSAIPTVVERSSLIRVENAFKAFFRRHKAKEKPGYPRFRSRDRYDSFGIGRAKTIGDGISIPKIGIVRFHRYRPLKGEVKHVEVKRECGKWFVCFACDLGAVPAKAPVSTAVGIDLGLTHFATLSNGEQVENPRLFRDGEAVLAKRQRVLARKKRGSNRRKSAKLAVANSRRKVKNQRSDFHRKLACRLYRRFDLIAHEALSIRQMVHGNLGKSILDAAWEIHPRSDLQG